MPRPRSDKRSVTTRLTATEAAALRREKERCTVRSLSEMLERAVLALLEGTDLEREGLRVPSMRGEKTVTATFQISSRALTMIDEAVARHGYAIQDITRAAVDRLARAAEAEAEAARKPAGC